MTRSRLARFAALLASLLAVPTSATAGDFPRNPFLADSPNNQSHWNDAATDSTPAAVPRGHYCLTAGGAAVAYADTLGIPAYDADVGGKRVVWFFSGTALRKLHLVDGAFVEIARQPVRMALPGYRPQSVAARSALADELAALLASGDEAAIGTAIARQPNRLQTAVEDQVAQGVLYSLFTRDHGFIGANARGLVRIDNLDPADPFSGLAPPQQVRLPDSLFDDARARAATIFPADSVFGLGMTFNGYLVVSTLGGTIATLDRDSFAVIDTYRAPEGEVFTNGFATSPELGGGAVYIASNRKLYRLAVDDAGRIGTEPESGAWEAAYDPGERLPTGKIADGTGATPTLMGFGEDDDELVILTDGARKMRLVAFWRNGLPKDWRQRPGTLSPRIADQITVDFGPDFPVVQSEQSVVADDGNAFVINSILSGGSKPMPISGSFTRGLLAGTVRPLPRGIAMYRWDMRADRWRAVWQRRDVGTIATVPLLSRGSRMVVLNGTLEARPGRLFQLGFDRDDGGLVMSIDGGTDPRFNGAFTGLKTDEGGALMYTTLFGLVRFDVAAMQQAASPEQAGAAECGGG
ncbi:hypothetical protein CHX26_05470 [Porphyrobacter sp. HT-58-2]|uniref:hypothetical protein n=1 Tax=Porphyrobacter sp. HT-58-2 TaxID=2023229 RepID=UPI000CDBDCA8|nr:hypothetical protein [Porphyrobacter sp. HT-58-2]AUX69024.1 hypothetical protein CHX26_05470 [Porphyrobacter sp. HT-58-2]